MATSNQKLVFSFLLLLASFFLVEPSLSRATEPVCNDIEDQAAYEELILDHPAIIKFGEAFTIDHVEVGPCEPVQMSVMYQIPMSDPQSDLTYTDGLFITYAQGGDSLVFLDLGTGQSNPLAYEAIMTLTQARVLLFQQQIERFEHDPRIQEYLEQTDIQYKVIPLNLSPSISLVGEDRTTLFYDLASDSILYYTLSHKVQWQQFPKLTQSHQLVTEKLLRGRFRDCVIDEDGYTNVREPDEAVSFVSVIVNCDKGEENLEFSLNPDGSYAFLEADGRIVHILPYLGLILGIAALVWGAMKFFKKV